MNLKAIKKTQLVIGFAAAGILCWGLGANANDEFIAQCEAYAQANGSSIDCECLDEAAEADPSLYEEYAKVATPADAQNLSEAAKAVIAACSAN